MLRKLLVSTALAGVLATGAYAQNSEQSGAAQSDGQTQEMQADQGSSDASSGSDMAASSSGEASGNFLQQLSSDQYLASNLTGQSIFGSDAQDAEAVATIDNYLVGSDGQIVAAIVTTSGEESKTVAIPFDQISWSMQDGEPRATMASGGSDLSSMPTFTLPSEQQQQAAATGTEGGSTEQSGMASEGTATGDAAATGGSASATDPAAGGSSASGDAAGTASADASGSASGDAAGSASGDMAASGGSSDMAASGGSSDVPTSVGQDQFLSQNLIGADVLSGPGEDAESVGEVNDLVISSDGMVAAGVVGVGGFLGIGEKDVAVPFDQMELSKQEDGTPQVVYASDRTQLEEAPSFETERPEEGASGDQASGDQASGDQQAASSSNSGMNSDGGTGNNTTEAGQSAAAAAGAATAAAGAAAGSAANSADQAANEAGNEMEQAGDEAAQSADNAMNEAGQAAEEAGNDMEQAGDQAAQSAENAADEASTEMAQAENNATSGSSDQAASGDAASSEGGQSDMQPVEDTSSLTADDLIGTSVVGPNNESVGDVGDIVLTPEGSIEAVIIDVGGFLGIGEKPVSVNLDDLQFMRDSGGSLAVQTQMTEDQLENAPEYQPEENASGAESGATEGQNN